MKLLIALAAAQILHSQQDPETIRAAMQVSIDKQKSSVQRQVSTAGFFTLPWAQPPQVAVSGTGVECDPIHEPELSKLITDAARREDLKPDLIRAIIRRESAGNPCAVSSKGAQGLMQIMPATAAELGVSDPFDPKQNIDAGTRFLKQLLERYSADLKLALSAYNAGPARVQDKIPDIPETKEYVRAIVNDLNFE